MGVNEFNHNIYLIVVFYWAFRLLYVFLRGHARLLDWKVQVLYWISSISLAVWVNCLIDKLETILPSPQSLIEQLWLLIILFIYSILNKLEFSRNETEKRKKKYVYKQYEKFHKRFGNQVDGFFNDDLLRAITFSIMIYENFNRSNAVRCVERFLFRKSKNNHTFGIMQVMSNRVLTDEESLSLGMQRILNDCRRIIFDSKEDDISTNGFVYDIAESYNGGDFNYMSEVLDVFNLLRDKFYSKIPDEFSKCGLRSGESLSLLRLLSGS